MYGNIGNINALKAPMEFVRIFRIAQRFTLAVIVATPIMTHAQGLYVNPLDAKMKRGLDAQNAKLPTMVAPTLRQEKMSVMNGVLTNTYTVINKTAAELVKMNLSVTQRPYIFPDICKAPDTGRMLKDGVSFKYLYLGNDGKLAAQIIIMPVDCKGQ